MNKKPNIIETLERDAAIRITANDYDEVPSEEIRKIQTLIQQSTRKKPVVISYRSYIIGRIAIALTFILIVGCISVYSFPIMIEQRIDRLIEQKGDIKVFNTPNNNLVLTDTELIVPTYVPPGYQGSLYGIQPPYSAVMQNEANERISLLQSTIKTGGTLDNEAQQNTVQINGRDAILEKRSDNSLRLMWEYAGFYFTLEASALPESELIKVAESIK